MTIMYLSTFITNQLLHYAFCSGQKTEINIYAYLCFLKLKHVIVMLGGGERDRTDDPLLAKQVLSQLSYTPVYYCKPLNFKSSETNLSSQMVGLGRFELPTSRLSGVRSNQLSYRPLP